MIITGDKEFYKGVGKVIMREKNLTTLLLTNTIIQIN